MRKDIEWLKEEIKVFQEGKNMFTTEFNAGVQDALEYVQELLDQLDEPEVLSQEWINEHEMPTSWMAKEQKVVRVEHLQSLLEPKQEEPVIPKFVAEWYESEGKRSSWWNWFYKWGRDESRFDLEAKTIKWMQDYNEEKFVNMFLHGYEVEERELTVKGVIEEHIELLKKQEVAVNLKPYYDLWEELKDE